MALYTMAGFIVLILDFDNMSLPAETCLSGLVLMSVNPEGYLITQDKQSSWTKEIWKQNDAQKFCFIDLWCGHNIYAQASDGFFTEYNLNEILCDLSLQHSEQWNHLATLTD